MMHTLGVFHEHNRPDRDSHVKILIENVVNGAERVFDKSLAENVNVFDTPYDYLSVMHYGKKVRYSILKLTLNRSLKQVIA